MIDEEPRPKRGLFVSDLGGACGVQASQGGLDASLPQPAPPQPATAPPPEAIVLEYAVDGRLAINHQPVALEDLHARLASLYATRRDKTLYLMGDGRLPYGRIVDAIDIAKGAGVDRVGVVTESMRRPK
jgi:biopolymer transport protein ExbD